MSEPHHLQSDWNTLLLIPMPYILFDLVGSYHAKSPAAEESFGFTNFSRYNLSLLHEPTEHRSLPPVANIDYHINLIKIIVVMQILGQNFEEAVKYLQDIVTRMGNHLEDT